MKMEVMNFALQQPGLPCGQVVLGDLLRMAARLPHAPTSAGADSVLLDSSSSDDAELAVAQAQQEMQLRGIRPAPGLPLPPRVPSHLSSSDEDGLAVAQAQQEMQLRGIRPAPGLPLPPGVPSHGSLMHGSGRCRPCMWFWKPTGCIRGEECLHCHLCPQTARDARKKVQRTEQRREVKQAVACRTPAAAQLAAHQVAAARPTAALLAGSRAAQGARLSRPNCALLSSTKKEDQKPRLSLQSLDTSVGSDSESESLSPPESPRQAGVMLPPGLTTPPGVFYIGF